MHTRRVFYRDAKLKQRAAVILFGDFQVNTGLDDRLFHGPVATTPARNGGVPTEITTPKGHRRVRYQAPRPCVPANSTRLSGWICK